MRIDIGNVPTVLCGCALLGAFAPAMVAHFRLLEPASWLQEGPNGDPQWLGPCGGSSADPGKPSGATTSVQGGEKLHIRIREMAFHPGFYRVALAVNSRDELPQGPGSLDTMVRHSGEIPFRGDSLSANATGSGRRPLPAHRSFRQGPGDRCPHPQHQLLQMHPAG